MEDVDAALFLGIWDRLSPEMSDPRRLVQNKEDSPDRLNARTPPGSARYPSMGDV
jgi:hypothetical protein